MGRSATTDDLFDANGDGLADLVRRGDPGGLVNDDGHTIFVALMAFRALAGQESRRQHDVISAAALFWYTTVVVYSVIWLAVYVTK